MELKVGIIKGDGIGPEIVEEAMKVLDKVGEVYGHTYRYKSYCLEAPRLMYMGYH